MSDSLWLHGLYSSRNSSGKNTGVGSLFLLQGIFPAQGLNQGLPHCRRILCQLSHKRSPRILEWVAYPFSSGSSQPRNQTRVSVIAGGLFTNWDIREVQIPPFDVTPPIYLVPLPKLEWGADLRIKFPLLHSSATEWSLCCSNLSISFATNWETLIRKRTSLVETECLGQARTLAGPVHQFGNRQNNTIHMLSEAKFMVLAWLWFPDSSYFGNIRLLLRKVFLPLSIWQTTMEDNFSRGLF